MMPRSEVIVMKGDEDEVGLLKTRGGRIDPMRVLEGDLDADARVDQAIAESFPASDPPSFNSGVDEKH
jgi:hypothetical protein